jgi:hypothetical protein
LNNKQEQDCFINYCELFPKEMLLVRVKSGGAKVQGHFTYLANDLFQIESDSPVEGMRDGCLHDLTDLPSKYSYVKEGSVTKECQKEAKTLLQEMYKAALLFERKRQVIQKILLDAIEKGNEQYAGLRRPENAIDEAFGIDLKGHVRKIDTADLAQFKDSRTAEECRDFHILNRIAFRCHFEYKTTISHPLLAKLLEKNYGVSFIYSNVLEEIIFQRSSSSKSI